MLRPSALFALLLCALPGVLHAASLVFTFDRDVSAGIPAGEEVTIFAGMSLDPGQELIGVQMDLRVGGAPFFSLEALPAVHRFEFQGATIEENPWTLTTAAVVTRFFRDLRFAHTMNEHTGPLISAPDYGRSLLAETAGFVPQSAPLGGIKMVSRGEAITLQVLPAERQRSLLVIGRDERTPFPAIIDLNTDFEPGEVFNLIPPVPEPRSALLIAFATALAAAARKL